MEIKINKSDSAQTRQAKRSYKRTLKGKKKNKQPHTQIATRSFTYNKQIEQFCVNNQIDTWSIRKAKGLRLGNGICLFDDPESVLQILLKLLHQATTKKEFPKIKVEGRVSFGALYLIDNMCWEIARKRKWEILVNDMCDDDHDILSKIRSIYSSQYQDEKAFMINEKVEINRSASPMANQQYKVRSTEITQMVEQGMREHTNPAFVLSQEAYQAISSTIGEHFDNIISHVPSAQHGYLCGFYNKNEKTISILIFNFGETIASTLDNINLPIQIKNEINAVVTAFTSKSSLNLFSKTFTVENALTLLSLQEGISSRLEYDRSRGHGLIDYIGHCFDLNKNCRISIISGKTAIKIDSKYSIKNKHFIDRERRIIAFNKSNDLYEKPDSDYVKNMKYHFPGVIIETIIPLI